MRIFKTATILGLILASTAACTRIETGEVGVRRGFDKTIQTEELRPGSFNQTMFGEVLHFHTKDVPVEVANFRPLAGDNSTIKDMDLTGIYNVNPSGAAELYMNKSSTYHSTTDDGKVYLMYNYIGNLLRNAAYKAVRAYPALKLADNRTALEAEILREVNEQLRHEKLDTEVALNQVIIRNIVPADAIVESANALVKAQNDTLRKTQEVLTARQEAERIATLNANSGATAYMGAQALLNISEAIQSGKVNTIVVPYDFKGIINIK